MRVLVVKTSSMGDVIHTLPAVTDAANAIESIEFDWLVEEDFAEIPRWHPAVKRVIPVALRRWRKNIIKNLFSEEFANFRKQLKLYQYDYIIDAQGLMKSAVLARMANGKVHGQSFKSAREPWAAGLYHYQYPITKQKHAIERVRKLFAKVLNYKISGPLDYGINVTRSKSTQFRKPKVMLLHGTTWRSKCWPATYWQRLATLLAQQGYYIYIPSGNTEEYERAKLIAGNLKDVKVMQRKSISELAKIIYNVDWVVAVDTGFAHLAAALNVPTISIYGATDSKKTGARGKSQLQLQADQDCSPCFSRRCKFTENSFSIQPCMQDLTPEKIVGIMGQG